MTSIRIKVVYKFLLHHHCSFQPLDLNSQLASHNSHFTVNSKIFVSLLFSRIFIFSNYSQGFEFTNDNSCILYSL